MDSFPLYVPNPEAPAELQAEVANIDPRSAIVGAPDAPEDQKRTLVYYEGNRYGSSSMTTLADRAMYAAGRLSMRYPTVARATVSSRALQLVGTFTPGHGVDVPDATSLIAVGKWLGLFNDGQLDSAAVARELRLSS